MNRRESLKTLVIGSLASSLVLEGCLSKEKEIIYENVWKYKYGRTPEELERDLKLLNQVFFSKEELNTIRVLANLIVFASTTTILLFLIALLIISFGFSMNLR